MPSNLDQGFGWIFEVTHDSVNGLVRKLAVIEGRDLDSCFDSHFSTLFFSFDRINYNYNLLLVFTYLISNKTVS